MASPGNEYCANCIGTLSHPISFQSTSAAVNTPKDKISSGLTKKYYITMHKADLRGTGNRSILAVSYTHLTLPTTPYV